ncbi:bifunctional ornithine acetyltransferase/N-acetylglutamate synthase, partial [Myxococcota bacterium]|nr:bifunctional ornithine acetyltransferase/N-acetylglutamate synthase [Myxococcota bacterium]
DLLFAALDEGTTVAGTLTRSLTCSAPVIWCRDSLPTGLARGLVVNAGNANAFTGKAGMQAVKRSAAAAAALIGCKASEVFVASTGVIGVPLDAGKIEAALPGLGRALDAGAWDKA